MYMCLKLYFSLSNPLSLNTSLEVDYLPVRRSEIIWWDVISAVNCMYMYIVCTALLVLSSMLYIQYMYLIQTDEMGDYHSHCEKFIVLRMIQRTQLSRDGARL